MNMISLRAAVLVAIAGANAAGVETDATAHRFPIHMALTDNATAIMDEHGLYGPHPQPLANSWSHADTMLIFFFLRGRQLVSQCLRPSQARL